MSEATIAELDEMLRRPKFDKYVPEEKRLEFLAALVQAAELVKVTEVVTACRDAKDNKFLELAVSGDDDLLTLHPFRGIAVVTPQAFLAGVQGSGAEPRAAPDRPRD